VIEKEKFAERRPKESQEGVLEMQGFSIRNAFAGPPPEKPERSYYTNWEILFGKHQCLERNRCLKFATSITTYGKTGKCTRAGQSRKGRRVG